MSAALRPDPAACPHADVHWSWPPKFCNGTPDGPGPEIAGYATLGGLCRTCRRPVLRIFTGTWGQTEAVSGAEPVPRRRYDGPGAGPYGRRHG